MLVTIEVEVFLCKHPKVRKNRKYPITAFAGMYVAEVQCTVSKQ